MYPASGSVVRRGRGYSLTVDGQAIQLTPTEWRLFQVLGGEPGRVFDRAELVRRVMPDSIVLERTIDVHIKSLRKKLPPSVGQIKTVFGSGYCFMLTPARSR